MFTVRAEVDLAPLIALKGKGSRIALRKAINRAAKPVRLAMIAEAERIARFGFTAKSIGTVTKVYRDRVIVVIGPKRKYSRTKGKFKTGPRAGQAKKFQPARYTKNVEKGTKYARPNPFVLPTLRKTAGEFQARLAAEVQAEFAAMLAAKRG